jgi:hypothetical protein
VALLAFVVFSGPTMACMLPGLPMTAAEQECCKKMAEQCGGVNMPPSHTCCNVVRKPDVSTMLKGDPVVVPTPDSIAAVAVLEADFTLVTFSLPRFVFESHSPPDPFSDSVQVLRI